MRREKAFVMGPIPVSWLLRIEPCCRARVGMLLAFLWGMRTGKWIEIGRWHREIFGVSRHQVRRALIWMEERGLVAVKRQSGRTVRVSMLDFEVKRKSTKAMNEERVTTALSRS